MTTMDVACSDRLLTTSVVAKYRMLTSGLHTCEVLAQWISSAAKLGCSYILLVA